MIRNVILSWLIRLENLYYESKHYKSRHPVGTCCCCDPDPCCCCIPNPDPCCCNGLSPKLPQGMATDIPIPGCDCLDCQKAIEQTIVRDSNGKPKGMICRPGDWIGVDFDGTLVTYDGWKGCEHFGEPIMSMVERVRVWLDNGIEVRILTARVGPVYPHQVYVNTETIKRFCRIYFGKELPITHEKDQNMIVLWDDKAWNPNCSGCTSSYWNK